MFELNDSLLDDIVFAMEDQDKGSRVDLASGGIVPRSPETEGDGFADPPEWSSRQGFRLMEDFLATVRSPSARQELTAALGRGRGVFKCFKETLAVYPDVERAYHEFKAQTMRNVIHEWYDDIREREGLSRLGPEPDDSNDLVESDFGIEYGPGKGMSPAFEKLAELSVEELLESFPAPVVENELDCLEQRLDDEDWRGVWVPDGEGGVIAAAAAAIEENGGRPLARVFFLSVQTEFRQAGIGLALLNRLTKELSQDGIDYMMLDLSFMPPSFCETFENSGFKPYGIRAYQHI